MVAMPKQGRADLARYLSDLQGMSQTVMQESNFPCDCYLSYSTEPTKSRRVQKPVSIALGFVPDDLIQSRLDSLPSLPGGRQERP
jgi:hypothetical protein